MEEGIASSASIFCVQFFDFDVIQVCSLEPKEFMIPRDDPI
jgi:hypothetical protein